MMQLKTLRVADMVTVYSYLGIPRDFARGVGQVTCGEVTVIQLRD